jgi:hypothetical protein
MSIQINIFLFMFIKAIWFYHLEKRKQGEGVCLSIHLHPLSHIEKNK